MPAFAWHLAAEATVRVASLNLCTDEYLLLLAGRGQIVSVSHLARDPRESVLWKSARRYRANSGTLESALPARPNLVLTMGGGGRSTAMIARRLGIKVLDLPFPETLDDVQRQSRQVAQALRRPNAAATRQHRLAALKHSAPSAASDAAFAGGDGLSLEPQSLGAQWMRLAGLRQRSLPGARLDLETMLTRPPAVILRSDYRAGQWNRGATWWAHPIVKRRRGQTYLVDGRAWTCAGLPMIDEIERLRKRM